MKETGIIIAILLGVILLVWLWFLFKPYFVRHDTTVLFTGGLGSGKTLETVKTAIILIRKQRISKYYWFNFKAKIKNKVIKAQNKHRLKKYIKLQKKSPKKAEMYKQKKPIKNFIQLNKKPMVYSNIPIHFKKHIFGTEREWATKLTLEHIMLLKEINEYSVVVIDEFPQFISQFEWDVDLVQTNCNEFITFFRHYIGGFLLVNAQSEEEIECHFRRKLNQGIWCFDMHIWPCRWLPIFYTNRMCDFVISENIQTMSTTYIEENTRLHFGMFPKKAYDSRCYSIRYKNIFKKIKTTEKWKKLKTVEVLRLKNYISPLDTNTSELQKKNMTEKVKRLQERNKDNEIK